MTCQITDKWEHERDLITPERIMHLLQVTYESPFPRTSKTTAIMAHKYWLINSVHHKWMQVDKDSFQGLFTSVFLFGFLLFGLFIMQMISNPLYPW